MIALLSKRLQKYSGYFYCARLEAKFLKNIFQASRSLLLRSFAGRKGINFIFTPASFLKRFFKKDLAAEKRFNEAEKSADLWAFPKDKLNTVTRKLVMGSNALKRVGFDAPF